MLVVMKNRAQQLAELFVTHCLDVQKGDNVLIEASDFTAKEVLLYAYNACIEIGANPYLDICDVAFGEVRADVGGFATSFFAKANDEQALSTLGIMQKKVEWADKFLRVFSVHDEDFLEKIPPKRIAWWNEQFSPLYANMIEKPWVLTYYPTEAIAVRLGLSYAKALDEYYAACLVDYAAEEKRLKNLEDILDAGSVVRIVGEGTDLTLGIEGRLAAGAESIGRRNVPDGECFLGPEEDKTEGVITFEWPQAKYGREAKGIRLRFEQGKIVEASAEEGQDFLEGILDAHEGNRRIGELGIGMNTHITTFRKNPLFDEKIAGTIHLALGRSYRSRRGGGKNEGTVHWDLVKDLRATGSFVSVDGKEIVKDGKILV